MLWLILGLTSLVIITIWIFRLIDKIDKIYNFLKEDTGKLGEKFREYLK